MRQVPYYLIIGDGRIARHFQYYLSLLHLPFVTWNRKQPLEYLHYYLKDVSHILILISDQAIENITQKYLQNSDAIRIHFSGSLVTTHAYGAHPLMTFNNKLYTLEEYKAIPFIIDDDVPDWKTLLPGIPNTYVRLDKSQKSKYHALCVLSGNFSCILWQKLFNSFEQEFDLPKSLTFPYLLRQTQNLIDDSRSALTGPLVRNDEATINTHLTALNADPFQEIYKSFVACYQKTRNKGG